jgi:hypothetical protein
LRAMANRTHNPLIEKEKIKRTGLKSFRRRNVTP